MIDVPGVSSLRELNSGANGAVYSGVEESLDRRVAVKVMKEGIDGGERRFEREVRAMGRLSDIPGIAPIYRSGFLATNQPYLVMPLYERSLQSEVLSAGAMATEDAVIAIERVARAIAAVHERGVLHLDIKPSNILLDARGEAFIADFGIAEMTDTSASLSAAMLTPQYAPPERFEGSIPSCASDVYSLAATLYALLVGHPPFATKENTGPAPVMFRIMQEDVPVEKLPATVPTAVVAAIVVCMAKEPDARPDALELADRLNSARTELGAGPTAQREVPGDHDATVPVGDYSDTTRIRPSSGRVSAEAPAASDPAVVGEETVGAEHWPLLRWAKLWAGLLGAVAASVALLWALIVAGGSSGENEEQSATTETAAALTVGDCFALVGGIPMQRSCASRKTDGKVVSIGRGSCLSDVESFPNPSTDTLLCWGAWPEPDTLDSSTTEVQATSESTAEESLRESDINVPTSLYGEVSIFELRVGDCVVGDIGAGQVTQVEKVNCDVEHEFEVYHEALIVAPIVEFDEPAISTYAEEACRTSLKGYIPPTDGRNLSFKFLQPTESSWNQGVSPDRVVTCLLFDGDGDPLVGRAN